MGIMGKGGEAVSSRYLQRKFEITKNPEVNRDTVVSMDDTFNIINDSWIVVELDEDGKVLYEKEFPLDKWSDAINYFGERSEHSVIWEKDI